MFDDLIIINKNLYYSDYNWFFKILTVRKRDELRKWVRATESTSNRERERERKLKRKWVSKWERNKQTKQITHLLDSIRIKHEIS